jgi:hypothetical protein
MTTFSLSLCSEPASTVFDPDASCFMPGKVECKNTGDDKEKRDRKKKRQFLLADMNLSG